MADTITVEFATINYYVMLCYDCLSSHSEYTKTELLSRCVKILSAPIPYNPKVDLVLDDLIE